MNSLPSISGALSPSPKLTAFTPGIAKSAAASGDSSPSASAPPSPAGRPVAVLTTQPPTESPASRAASIARTCRRAFVSPWIDSTVASTAMPRAARNCLQSPPAAQRAAVSRPEFFPPPVGMTPVSIHWPKSAWPGRGTVRPTP